MPIAKNFMFDAVFLINKKIVLLSVFFAWEDSIPSHTGKLCYVRTLPPHYIFLMANHFIKSFLMFLKKE